MRQSKKHILLKLGSTAAVFATVGAVSHAVSRLLVSFALDRKVPLEHTCAKAIQSRVRGCDMMESFYNELNTAGTSLKNSATQTIKIVSRDGVSLVGHLQMPSNPSRLVIAMHGWRSSWYRDFGMIADFLTANNCAVLYAEERGQNNSGGDCIGFGLLERYDCLDWIEWCNSRFSTSLPIYLAGVSMGGAAVLMAANLPLPSNVCGIVADCAFTSADAIFQHVARRNLHIPYRLHKANVAYLCRKKLHLRPDACTTTHTLKHCSVPILLIHGSNDHFVPVQMAYENFQAAAGPKKLFVVSGADHGMSYYMAKQEYEQAVLEFITFCEGRDNNP